MASKNQTSKSSQPRPNHELSRRNLLKSIGTASLAALVPEAGTTETLPRFPATLDSSRATNKSDLVRLSSGRMIAMFDRRNGILYSITEAHDA